MAFRAGVMPIGLSIETNQPSFTIRAGHGFKQAIECAVQFDIYQSMAIAALENLKIVLMAVQTMTLQESELFKAAWAGCFIDHSHVGSIWLAGFYTDLGLRLALILPCFCRLMLQWHSPAIGNMQWPTQPVPASSIRLEQTVLLPTKSSA